MLSTKERKSKTKLLLSNNIKSGQSFFLEQHVEYVQTAGVCPSEGQQILM